MAQADVWVLPEAGLRRNRILLNGLLVGYLNYGYMKMQYG